MAINLQSLYFVHRVLLFKSRILKIEVYAKAIGNAMAHIYSSLQLPFLIYEALKYLSEQLAQSCLFSILLYLHSTTTSFPTIM